MPVVVSSLLHSATWELIWTAARSATWVPNARTERPDHSRCIGNFTFNQNHPTRSVKSWILCTKDLFQEKLLEKAYFAGYRSPDKSGRIWPIYLRIKATGLDCPITAVISLISAVWCVWYFTANSILIFFRSSLLGGREVTTRNKSTWCLLFAGYVIQWIFTSDQASGILFLLVKGKPLIDYWDSEDCWFSSQVVCTAESVFCYPGSRGPFPMEPRVAFFRKRLHSVQGVQCGFATHSWRQGDDRESSQSGEWAGECSEWSAENGECN